MKKIAFVIESLQLGGAEKCLVTLLNHLDYTKFDVDLILFNEEGFFRDQVHPLVKIVVLKNKKMSFFQRLIYFLKKKTNGKTLHHAQILWSIIGNDFKLISKQYDVVVAYNQGFATYFASKYLRGEKKIAWLNTNYKEAGYNIDFDFPFYSKYHTVVAVSNEVEQIFKSILNNSNYSLNTTTILDIVDDQEIMLKAKEPIEVHFDKNNFNIVSVGRLAKPKAFDLAILACKILVDKGYDPKWYVIGEGKERLYLENLISRNQLTKNFFLLGAAKNPYPYVAQATIFVQTSLFEGLGTTIIEASILKKPIVSTNFPSIYSLITDEETGLIANMNPESIAVQIERLMESKSLRQLLSKNLESIKNNSNHESIQKIEKLLLIP